MCRGRAIRCFCLFSRINFSWRALAVHPSVLEMSRIFRKGYDHQSTTFKFSIPVKYHRFLPRQTLYLLCFYSRTVHHQSRRVICIPFNFIFAVCVCRELSRFIAAGRLHCKIDKVGGIVETNRPDSKNWQYQESIKKGDLLLNRVQKLSRVINI